MFNQTTLDNTALTAVLTYRLIGASALMHERFTPTQRDKLDARINALRPHQAKDADGKWIFNTYDAEGIVDYMVVNFEQPVENAPAFFITYPLILTK